MSQQLEFDCAHCERRFECALHDIPNYCPKRDGENGKTGKNHVVPIQYWGAK